MNAKERQRFANYEWMIFAELLTSGRTLPYRMYERVAEWAGTLSGP